MKKRMIIVSLHALVKPKWTGLGVGHPNAVFVLPDSQNSLGRLSVGLHHGRLICASHRFLLAPLSASLATSRVSHSAVVSTTAPANGSRERRQPRKPWEPVPLMAVGNGSC